MKNNLSQSKTNNESNFVTQNNDINIYLNKYIFNKNKTRNRENNIYINKNTFNLSNQKYDIGNSINAINTTYIKNITKTHNFGKNFFIKSRNKIPSCHKGRPNTIINKTKKLVNKKKQNSKEKKDLSTNLKNKKRNYSMIGYSNIININLNQIQNLTDRENKINNKDNNNMNKSTNTQSKNKRHNKVLSGIYINLSNIGHITKKEINSERNKKVKNSYIRIMSQNKYGYTKKGAFLRHNAFYKAKLSFVSSHSVSKSKSNIKNKKKKNNSKINNNQNLKQKRNKSNLFSNTLIEDLSKMKKINNKQKNIIIDNNKKRKKTSKDFGIEIFQKKIVGRNQKNYSNLAICNIINNNDKTSGAMTSRTRNLKTYNIFFKTNSIDIDKNKLNEINNKENLNVNMKPKNNNITTNNNIIIKKNCSSINELLKNPKNSDNYMKKVTKNNILKNNVDKVSNDNNIYIPKGIRKIYSGNKTNIKNK